MLENKINRSVKTHSALCFSAKIFILLAIFLGNINLLAQNIDSLNNSLIQIEQANDKASESPEDFILLISPESKAFTLEKTIQGSRRLKINLPTYESEYKFCYVDNLYQFLIKDGSQHIANNQVRLLINSLAKGRKLRGITVGWYDNGNCNGTPSSAVDVIVRPRKNYLDNEANKSREIGFIPRIKLSEAADEYKKRLDEISRNIKEINEFSINSKEEEKVGSITLKFPSIYSTNINVCNLSYEGDKAEAILGYIGNIKNYLSPKSKESVENTLSILEFGSVKYKNWGKSFQSIDDFYSSFQSKSYECNFYVDFIGNLKILIAAFNRDAKNFSYEVNDLVSKQNLRLIWAQQLGFPDLETAQFSLQINANKAEVHLLIQKGIKNLKKLEEVINEMFIVNYVDKPPSAGEVITYLDDKLSAERNKSGTANSVKDARLKLKQQELDLFSSEFPLTAIISCGNGFSVGNCMKTSQGVVSQLELRNGVNYKMYQPWDVRLAGKESNNGLLIDLRSNFSLKIKNINDHSLLLTVEVIRKADGQRIFIKSAGRFEEISLENQ